MSMAVGATGGPKSDINMTPMIDVLLVLIIIFMVITPLTPRGLEALVPQPPPPGQPPNQSDQRTVVVEIDANHQMSSIGSPLKKPNWDLDWPTSLRRGPSMWFSLRAIRRSNFSM